MTRIHHAHSHEANSIDHDVQHLSAKELADLYGIEFFEDPDSKIGRVFDSVANKEYDSLADWASAQVEEEEWSGLAHAHQNNRLFDDEY